MPPKAKFTRKQITDAALRLVETEGFEKLTARNLGEKLGSSSRPIFTSFKSMDEVIAATERQAYSVYTGYVDKGLEEALPFKGVGMSYIRFATERPKLFALLFMTENGSADAKSVLRAIEPGYDKILRSVIDNYGLDAETSKKLYLHLWIYTHGIAALIATKACRFTEEEISGMLTDVFVSLLARAKKGELR